MVVRVEPRAARVVGPVRPLDERETPHPMVDRGELGERLRLWRKNPTTDPLIKIFGARNEADPGNSLPTILTDAPDGKVNPVVTPVPDPAHMAANIKEIARFLGADVVGIAHLDQRYVYTHRARGGGVEGTKAGDPIDLPHKYAICLGKSGDFDRYMASLSSISDAEYALGNTLSMIPTFLLAAYIRQMGYPARWHAYGKGEVNPIPLAVMAGLGELGRHGMLINEKYSSRLHLTVVTTDLPLEVDQPVDIGVEEFCRYCKKCARTCPSRSITFSDVKDVYNGVEKWRINVESCYKHRAAAGHNCLWCTTSCCYHKMDTWYHKLTIWLLRRTPVPLRPPLVKPLVWVDDLLWGKRPYVRARWLDYDSDLDQRTCQVPGCKAEHKPTFKKRLQRPGRWVQSRLFPNDELRPPAPHTDGARGDVDVASGPRTGAA